MMIALAMRCDDIMYDREDGDRTGYWFWWMIENLGLSDCVNEWIDFDFVDQKLKDFMSRNLPKSGKGGLFWTGKNGLDFRKMEIWYQMNQWLLENFMK